MPTKRNEIYAYVSGLAQWMDGDRSCQWAVWFRSRWKNFEQAKDDFDWESYRVEHTILIDRIVKMLIREGYSVTEENQNWFRYYDETGVIVGGKPDIIAVRDDDALIVDAKAAKERRWHRLQVLLPMALEPNWDNSKLNGLHFRGRLIYNSGEVIDISPEEIGNIRARIPYFLDIISGPEEGARRVPSEQECRFCSITSADCPDRRVPDDLRTNPPN